MLLRLCREATRFIAATAAHNAQPVGVECYGVVVACQ